MKMAAIARRSSRANLNASIDTPTSPSKKPKRRNERNILTFYEKIAVIRYYDETNISRNSLAKMFHCCATQIRRILERKQELLQQLATLSEADASIIIEEMTRKRRKFEMSAISFILHQWVERCRQMQLRKVITNETLKETAVKMAAILNLPAFRPSYRWLNRFRGKHKYNDEDLGSGQGPNTVEGELAVEDIIIEFKDSLPSFMQKEILAITSSAKVDDAAAAAASEVKRTEVPVIINDDNSNDDFEISDDDDDENMNDSKENNRNPVNSDRENDVEIIEIKTKEAAQSLTVKPSTNAEDLKNITVTQDYRMNAGSAALMHSIFPHLAVIHQFALLNSDVKALELISQLGVHMKTQADEGAYKQLSLATSASPDGDSEDLETNGDNIYPDIDDIILIE